MTKYTAKTFPNKDVSQVILQAVKELVLETVQHASSQTAKVEPAHILLVEDNAGDTLLVQQALTSCLIPIKLHIARDGEQGLAMLAAADFAPSLIMLDLNMPRIGGFTFLQRYQPRDIPVVVFSVSPLEADRQYALELGASEYVQKPIELEDFTNVVYQIVLNWLGQKETSAAVP